jgi:class 3 adenylate cyclase
LLDRGWRLWQQIAVPYESARARELLGRARAADGDATASAMDMRAAFAVFQELGAALDVQRMMGILGDANATSAGTGTRVARTFMFTDIVTSTDLVGLIGDAAWEELLRWHDHELRSAFSRHRGEEVKHTGDGFFVAFERASDGIECAVAIQRGLAAHRRKHGFAPWVRIGLHTDDATRQGGDYSGGGVHVAARVGAIGEREEIYITSAVLEEAGGVRFPMSEPRTMNLKGVADPVEVRTVDWH